MTSELLSVAVAIHLVACPFKYLTLNVLEASSLLVSIVTLYSGLVFTDENTSRSVRVLLSLLLILINVSLALVFILAVFFYGDRFVVAKLKFMEVTSIPKNPALRICSLIYLLFRGTSFTVTGAAQSIRWWFGAREQAEDGSGPNRGRITESAGPHESMNHAVQHMPPARSYLDDNNGEISAAV